MGDSTAEVMRHSRMVNKYIKMLAHALIHNAEGHDLDKVEPRVKSIWDKFSPHLKAVFGSLEYQQRKAELKPVLDDHYARTTHHPEHFENGVSGMNLMQLAEYLADNWERCQTLGDGDLRHSLEVNREPHRIDNQTMQILLHTAEYFGWVK